MGWAIKGVVLVICISFMLYFAGYQAPLFSYMSLGVSGISGSGYSAGAQVDFLSMIMNSLGSFVAQIYTALSGALGVYLAGIAIGLALLAVTVNSELMGLAIKASIAAILGNLILIPSAELMNSSVPILPYPFTFLFVILMNVIWLAACLSILSGVDA